jgi:plastocyanin
MNKVVLGVSVALFITVTAVGVWFLREEPEKVQSPSMSRGEVHAMVLGSVGYEPKELFIKKGDIVEFSTTRGFEHWPASDVHPTHNIYPDFDPLRPLESSEVWEFQFTEAGEWGFHDHLHSTYIGTIHVSD